MGREGLLSISFAQFLHPCCGGAWRTAIAQSKPNHRASAEGFLLGQGGRCHLLAIEPGKQLKSQMLVKPCDALEGKVDGIHGERLTQRGHLGNNRERRRISLSVRNWQEINL